MQRPGCACCGWATVAAISCQLSADQGIRILAEAGALPLACSGSSPRGLGLEPVALHRLPHKGRQGCGAERAGAEEAFSPSPAVTVSHLCGGHAGNRNGCKGLGEAIGSGEACGET